jgi:hypothetical protein
VVSVFYVYIPIHYFNSPGWNASLQDTFSRQKILGPPLLCYMIASKEMLLQVKVVWNIAGSSLAHIKMHDAFPIKKKSLTTQLQGSVPLVLLFKNACSCL